MLRCRFAEGHAGRDGCLVLTFVLYFLLAFYSPVLFEMQHMIVFLDRWAVCSAYYSYAPPGDLHIPSVFVHVCCILLSCWER